jgi:hypothetical protein
MAMIYLELDIMNRSKTILGIEKWSKVLSLRDN